MRPLLRWEGNKYPVSREILSFLPPNITKIVEPFAGSMAVSFRFTENNSTRPYIFAFDNNQKLIQLYKEIATSPQIIGRKYSDLKEVYDNLDSMADKSSFYYVVRHNYNSSYCPTRFLFLNWTCADGAYVTDPLGFFTSSFGDRESIPDIDFNIYHQMFKKWSFIDKSFFETSKWLKNMHDGKTLIYCDPPRFTDGKDSGFSQGYCDEIMDEVVFMARQAKKPFAISTYLSDNTGKIFKNLFINEIKTRGRNTEILVTNW